MAQQGPMPEEIRTVFREVLASQDFAPARSESLLGRFLGWLGGHLGDVLERFLPTGISMDPAWAAGGTIALTLLVAAWMIRRRIRVRGSRRGRAVSASGRTAVPRDAGAWLRWARDRAGDRPQAAPAR